LFGNPVDGVEYKPGRRIGHGLLAQFGQGLVGPRQQAAG
jgi:hypothetical protein